MLFPKNTSWWQAIILQGAKLIQTHSSMQLMQFGFSFVEFWNCPASFCTADWCLEFLVVGVRHPQACSLAGCYAPKLTETMTATVGLRAAAWEAGSLSRVFRIPQIFRIPNCPCFLANRESTICHWMLVLMFPSISHDRKLLRALEEAAFLAANPFGSLACHRHGKFSIFLTSRHGQCHSQTGASSFSSSNCRAKASPPSS